MSINNKGLSNIFLESEMQANDLITYFQIIIKLIKKHGQNLFTDNVLSIIKNTDINTYLLLQILTKHKKNKILDIKNIIKTIKESDSYKPTFEINMIETSKKYTIKEDLKNKFPNSNIKTNDNIDLGVFVHGEGRYYKRNIDQDLGKILG